MSTFAKRALPWLFALAIAANLFELGSQTIFGWYGQPPAVSGAEPVLSPVSIDANHFRYPVPGKPYVLVVHRGARTILTTVIARPASIGLDQIIRLAGVFWVLTFAFLIAVKGAKTRENTILVLILVLEALQSPIDRTIFPSMTAIGVYRMMGDPVVSVVCVLLAIYGVLFGTVGRGRRALFAASLAVIAVEVIALELRLGQYFAPALRSYGAFFNWQVFVMTPQLLFPLLGIAAAIPSARTDERQRLAWILAAFVPFLVGWTLGNALSGQTGLWVAVQNVSFFFIPAGLTYAALARKLFDIGFVLNRAAVFAGVSAIVVGAFVLLEWALGSWFEQSGRETGLALNAALALALGLSLRFVHHRVDRFVDAVFFRKRHEDETALRAFAREAAYVTDAPALLERTRQIILARSDASSVEIRMPTGAELNDPAVLAMRASQDAVELHRYATAICGDYAFPMLAHGGFLGVLVCGEKRSGERYARDEIDALKTLAHGVGLALESLARNKPIDEQFESLREAITRVHEAMTDLPAALARELRAAPVD